MIKFIFIFYFNLRILLLLAPMKIQAKRWNATMSLKNWKAARTDEISAESTKADPETSINMLHTLFIKIWDREEILAESKEGILIKFLKKETDMSHPGLAKSEQSSSCSRTSERPKISQTNMICLFHSNVKTLSLYGSETWRTKYNHTKTPEVCKHESASIYDIRWPERICNKDL